MGTWLVGGIVGLIVFLAARSVLRDKQRGGCAGCAGCANMGNCSKREE